MRLSCALKGPDYLHCYYYLHPALTVAFKFLLFCALYYGLSYKVMNGYFRCVPVNDFFFFLMLVLEPN